MADVGKIRLEIDADLTALKKALKLVEGETVENQKKINAALKKLDDEVKVSRLKMWKELDAARAKGETNVQMRAIEAKWQKEIETSLNKKLNILKQSGAEELKILKTEREIQNAVTRQVQDRAFLSDRILEGLSAKYSNLGKIISTMTGDSQKFGEGIGGSLGKAGLVVGGITAGVALLKKGFDVVFETIDKGLDSIKQLESGVASTLSLMSSKDQAQFGKEFSDGLKQIRTETGETFDNLAKGLYNLQSAGFGGADAIKNLEVASKAAIAGVTDINTAVDLGTTGANAWNVSMEDVFNSFQQAVVQGKTTLPELNANLGQIAATAAQAGISVDQTAAAIATMTLKGVKTPQAITSLNAFIMDLKRPETGKALKDLGINVFDSAGNLKDFTQITKEFAKVQWTDQLRASTKISQEGGKAFAILTQNVGNAESAFSKMMKNWDAEQLSGKVQQAFDVINNTSAQATKRYEANLEVLSMNLAETVTPVVNAYKTVVRGLVDTLVEWTSSDEQNAKKHIELSQAYRDQSEALKELQKQYLEAVKNGTDQSAIMEQIKKISPELANQLSLINKEYGFMVDRTDIVNDKFEKFISLTDRLSQSQGIQAIGEFSDTVKELGQFRTELNLDLAISQDQIDKLKTITGMEIDFYTPAQISMGNEILNIQDKIDKEIAAGVPDAEKLKDLEEEKLKYSKELADSEKSVQAVAKGYLAISKSTLDAEQKIKAAKYEQRTEEKLITALYQERNTELKKSMPFLKDTELSTSALEKMHKQLEQSHYNEAKNAQEKYNIEVKSLDLQIKAYEAAMKKNAELSKEYALQSINISNQVAAAKAQEGITGPNYLKLKIQYDMIASMAVGLKISEQQMKKDKEALEILKASVKLAKEPTKPEGTGKTDKDKDTIKTSDFKKYLDIANKVKEIDEKFKSIKISFDISDMTGKESDLKDLGNQYEKIAKEVDNAREAAKDLAGEIDDTITVMKAEIAQVEKMPASEEKTEKLNELNKELNDYIQNTASSAKSLKEFLTKNYTPEMQKKYLDAYDAVNEKIQERIRFESEGSEIADAYAESTLKNLEEEKKYLDLEEKALDKNRIEQGIQARQEYFSVSQKQLAALEQEYKTNEEILNLAIEKAKLEKASKGEEWTDKDEIAVLEQQKYIANQNIILGSQVAILQTQLKTVKSKEKETEINNKIRELWILQNQNEQKAFDIEKKKKKEKQESFDWTEKLIEQTEKQYEQELKATELIANADDKKKAQDEIRARMQTELYIKLSDYEKELQNEVKTMQATVDALKTKTKYTEEEKKQLDEYWKLQDKIFVTQGKMIDLQNTGQATTKKNIDQQINLLNALHERDLAGAATALEKSKIELKYKYDLIDLLSLKEKMLQNDLAGMADLEKRRDLEIQIAGVQKEIFETKSLSVSANKEEEKDILWAIEKQKEIISLKLEGVDLTNDQKKASKESADIIISTIGNYSQVVDAANGWVTAVKGGVNDFQDVNNIIGETGNTLTAVGNATENEFLKMAGSILTAWEGISTLVMNIFGVETAEQKEAKRVARLQYEKELLQDQLDYLEKIYEIERDVAEKLGNETTNAMRDINQAFKTLDKDYTSVADNANVNNDELRDTQNLLGLNLDTMKDSLNTGVEQAKQTESLNRAIKDRNALEEQYKYFVSESARLKEWLAEREKYYSDRLADGNLSAAERAKLEAGQAAELAEINRQITQIEEGEAAVLNLIERQNKSLQAQYDAQYSLIEFLKTIGKLTEAQALREEKAAFKRQLEDKEWIKAQTAGMTAAEIWNWMVGNATKLKQYDIDITEALKEEEEAVAQATEDAAQAEEDKVQKAEDLLNLKLQLSKAELDNYLKEKEIAKGEELTEQEKIDYSKEYYDQQLAILNVMLSQEKLKLGSLTDEASQLESKNEIENIEGQILDLYLAQVAAKEELNDAEDEENTKLKEAYKTLQKIRSQAAITGWTSSLLSQETAAKSNILTTAQSTGVSSSNIESIAQSLGLKTFATGGFTGSNFGLVHPGEFVIPNKSLSPGKNLTTTQNNDISINMNISGTSEQIVNEIKKQMPVLINSTLKRASGTGLKGLIA